MRSPRRPLLLLACIACVFGVAPAAHGAQGLTPDKQGWWTATAAPVPLGAAADGAPDVAKGELYVSGSSGRVVAVAALRYVIPSGTAVDDLDLTVAPGTVTVPGTKLRACPLTGNRDFTAAEGAPANEAPTWDCATAVAGELDPAGVAYRFSVATLVDSGVLAIAIVPAGTADRVVLAGPDPTALSIREPPPPPASASRPAAVPPSPAHGSASRPVAPAAPSRATPPVAAPVAPVALTPSASVQRDRPGLTGHGNTPPGAMLGTLAVVAIAAGVWWRGRQALAALTAGDR